MKLITFLYSALSHASSSHFHPTAYFTSFGAEGPRKPLHGPNHGAQVFGLTALACIGSFGVFSLFRNAGKLELGFPRRFADTTQPDLLHTP